MGGRRHLQGLLPGSSGGHVVAPRGQVDPQRAHDLRLVVDHQDFRHDTPPRSTGSDSTTVSPPPGVSSVPIVPPIASMNPLATDMPSPIPLFVSPSRWNGANTASALP